MKYYVISTLDKLILWYGDIEDDWEQFGIINGQFAFFYHPENFWFEPDKKQLEYLFFELPTNTESEKRSIRTESFEEAINYFLTKSNKKRYDIIKVMFK